MSERFFFTKLKNLWQKKQPNLVVNIYVFNFPTSSQHSDAHSENESRVRHLFTCDGLEDPQRTKEERNRFLNFLSDHDIKSRIIDSSKDNPVLRAVVCFCVKWRNLRYTEANYSPNAVVRFLFETCKLKKGTVDERAISNRLRDMIKKGYDKELFYDVCQYFN